MKPFAACTVMMALAAPLLNAAFAQEPEETSLISICRTLRRNVVAVTAVKPAGNDPSPDAEEEIISRFSGVVIDADGHIATVADVLPADAEVRVRVLDGRVYAAKIVGRDLLSNIGVLQTKAEGLRPVLPPPTGEPPVGTKVIAVGNPFGLYHSVAEGIISGTGRTLAAGKERLIRGMLQTTAPINPGDAGGLLADRRGRFVGMVSSTFGRAPSHRRIRGMITEAIRTLNKDPEFRDLMDKLGRLFFSGLAGENTEELQNTLEKLSEKLEDRLPGPGRGSRERMKGAPFGAQGINFAVPADRVLSIARELIRRGRVVRGRLGAKVLSLFKADYHRMKYRIPEEVQGVLVLSVDPEGPASRAGIRPLDVIRSYQGEAVRTPDALMRKVFETGPGTTVKVTVWRRGEGALSLEVLIEEMKAE